MSLLFYEAACRSSSILDTADETRDTVFPLMSLSFFCTAHILLIQQPLTAPIIQPYPAPERFLPCWPLLLLIKDMRTMNRTVFAHGLYKRFKQEIRHHWQVCINYAFVRYLSAMNPTFGAFRRYLVQDDLCLIQCARSDAILGYKVSLLPQICAAVISLTVIVKVWAMLPGYCVAWAIGEESMVALTYTSYLLNVSHCVYAASDPPWLKSIFWHRGLTSLRAEIAV